MFGDEVFFWAVAVAVLLTLVADVLGDVHNVSAEFSVALFAQLADHSRQVFESELAVLEIIDD